CCITEVSRSRITALSTQSLADELSATRDSCAHVLGPDTATQTSLRKDETYFGDGVWSEIKIYPIAVSQRGCPPNCAQHGMATNNTAAQKTERQRNGHAREADLVGHRGLNRNARRWYDSRNRNGRRHDKFLSGAATVSRRNRQLLRCVRRAPHKQLE